MKSITNILVILILVAFSGTVLAGESEYKASDNEELFGKWVNTAYEGEMRSQMLVFKLGEFERYSSANDNEPIVTGELHISDKWTDAKGNIWYKARWKTVAMGSGFTLFKISESGKTLERVWNQWEHPKELDINNETYRVYYRK